MRAGNKALNNREESSGVIDGWEWRSGGWCECKTSREATLQPCAKIASRTHKRSVKASSIYVRTVAMLVLKRIPYIALKISTPNSVVKGHIVPG